MLPGELVEVRSVYRGRVRWAFPWRVAADDGELLVTYLAPGAQGVWMGRDGAGRYVDRWVTDEPPHAHTWTTHHVLALSRRGEAHSLWLLWSEDWTFHGWYVQLQEPLVERDGALETTDHALDVWVDRDGSWRWKDEADFAEARALGVFDDAKAAAIRAEAERVVAAKPWPTGWEEWRPDPSWTEAEL
jgi:Protein of unknown function (DUF402)